MAPPRILFFFLGSSVAGGVDSCLLAAGGVLLQQFGVGVGVGGEPSPPRAVVVVGGVFLTTSMA